MMDIKKKLMELLSPTSLILNKQHIIEQLLISFFDSAAINYYYGSIDSLAKIASRLMNVEFDTIEVKSFLVGNDYFQYYYRLRTHTYSNSVIEINRKC